MEIYSNTGLKYEWDKDQQVVIYTKNMMFGHFIFFVKKEKDSDFYSGYKVFRFLDHTIVKYSKKLKSVNDYNFFVAWRKLLNIYLKIDFDDVEKILSDIFKKEVD